jgi:hypothetical protein
MPYASDYAIRMAEIRKSQAASRTHHLDFIQEDTTISWCPTCKSNIAFYGIAADGWKSYYCSGCLRHLPLDENGRPIDIQGE